MKTDSYDISVIIPAKDEEKRLPIFLNDLIAYCRQSQLRYEIIIVDDGSSDNTTTIAKTYLQQFKDLSVISNSKNRGKGFAVKQGLLASKGKFALFMDADGSTPPTEIERHLHYFNQGIDIIIGSRVLNSPHCKVEALFYRRFMGTIFNYFVSTFLINGIKDTQCGFKIFRSQIIRPLWSKVILEGFGFDLEVLFLAQQMKLKIKEVPVNWAHVDGSKIDPVKDSWRMLQNIFQIRRMHR